MLNIRGEKDLSGGEKNMVCEESLIPLVVGNRWKERDRDRETQGCHRIKINLKTFRANSMG